MPIRLLIAAHRWMGVALCVLFLLWFPSGIGMMYWGMPAISVRDRMERAPALDPAAIALSPVEAAERIGITPPPPSQIRLNSFDGRPVYRFGGGGRGGAVGSGQIVYADTGEEQFEAPEAMRHRAVAAWVGQPASRATIESVTEPDQWIVGNQFRNLRPLWKYSFPDGQAAYIGETGEVLLHTTRLTRLQAYLSAVPHWLYFTPLRANQPFWIRFATYSAMVGTAGVLVGIVLGVWLYSPRKKYRHAGTPSRIPYKGQKRWHTMLGLVFGAATFTWTLSGSLAFLPFPEPVRRVEVRRDQPPTQPGRRRGQVGPQGQGPRGRFGGDQSLAAALRGETGIDDYAGAPPREILRKLPPGAKELTHTSFAGRPLYSATFADGAARLYELDGREVAGFAREEILDIVRATVPAPGALEIRDVHEYDYYYLDRNRVRPLPVILALTHDAAGTRYYIDPKTGTVAGTYSDRNWARRFFYNGLHSLSFPWLYNRRPLWDIVVIAFMLGGTALCLTSLVLAWRVLGRKLRALAPAYQRAMPSSVRS